MNLALARARNRWLRFCLRGRQLDPRARVNLTALDGLRLDDMAQTHRFVVVDLETTGLDPSRDRVVSVGAFRMVGGRVRLGEVFSELCNPGRDIPVESIKVHAIVPDMIREARSAWEVFHDFLEFLGTDILVAHYASFDVFFMNRVMRASFGFPLQNLMLDTVELCRTTMLKPDPYGVYVDFRKCGLDALAELFDLQVPERHTALGDALATALIFQRFLHKLESEGRGRLRDVIRLGAMSS
ncbi:MAG: 3'-5' exonuclease [Pseudomonadota bacterium]